jgi:GDP-4-dehydro-6-deoxy-D-mannose reductase
MTPRRVLVTGGAGFVGRWLGQALLARGDDLVLSGLGDTLPPPPHRGVPSLAGARWIPANVESDRDVARLVEAAAPDIVFHLAGVTFVPTAEGRPADTYEVNVVGSVRLLSTLAAGKSAGVIDPIVIVVGSSTQYGAHPASAMPLDEGAAQCPASVYGATKAAQEIAAIQIARSSGLRVTCTRSFSHSGVGQSPDFLLPSLVERVRAVAARGGNVAIGNDVVRDYLHVDDVVAAYLALADHGSAGEIYNVCSGAGVSVRQLAEAAVTLAGVEAKVVSEASLRRAADMQVLVGCADKLRAATGWVPKKTHLDILRDLLGAT